MEILQLLAGNGFMANPGRQAGWTPQPLLRQQFPTPGRRCRSERSVDVGGDNAEIELRSPKKGRGNRALDRREAPCTFCARASLRVYEIGPIHLFRRSP